MKLESMDLMASSSSENPICALCKENERRYVCPKCGIDYCSLECYRSQAHLDCSETFYKNCVEEELRSQQSDSHVKQKTLDILQRIYNEDIEDTTLRDILEENNDDENEDNLDSDDENVEPLEQRLKNINLDNPDELWSALTDSERQEFEALVQSGDATKLLPSWNPWWNYHSEKPLIQDLSEEKQEQIYVDKCPKILDVPALKSIFKASPFIKFSIVNALHAYAYTVLHLNGEHQSTPLDAVYIFLQICDTMRINRIFKDNVSAVENVLLNITNCEALTADQETILETKAAGDAICTGPEDDNKTFYGLSALSDLHQLMYKAKKDLSGKKSKSELTNFKKKFQSNIDLPVDVTKKNLSLYLKKLEFYVSWLKSQSKLFSIIDEDE